ncbi:MAG: efflux RND transporter periplasmic adaptor subunit, partial [Acidobacteria bacterium]|nr:efflux RND transporter periplasmic adaptor subunit [Acidobacteriota bacterium]
VEVRITAVGTIEPENRVIVAAQEEGLITGLRVREGDALRRGDLIAELDDRELRAQLAQAEARLIETRAQWERASQLLPQGLVTQAEADSARAARDIAIAQGDALRTRLSFTQVRAPVAGIVTARHVEVGQVAAARAPIVDLAAGRTVLRVPVSELDVVRLSRGDRATVHVDALPGVPVPARVERIFPAANSGSRQVTVELVLDEVPAGVRPGFLARAELVLERLPQALMVPEPAVLRGSEVQNFVYVVEDGVAKVRAVKVGLRQDGQARIVEGLRGGEQVITEGMALVRDGAPVRVSGAGA